MLRELAISTQTSAPRSLEIENFQFSFFDFQLNRPRAHRVSALINTPLEPRKLSEQRGGSSAREMRNRFNGFLASLRSLRFLMFNSLRPLCSFAANLSYSHATR